MKKRQVLVTGACGFLGSHLVDALLNVDGFSVRATDIPEADRTFLNPKADFIPSNLRNPKSLEAVLRGVKVVYHAAALFRYSAKWDDLYAVNVEGTQHLCQTAINADVSQLMLVSSAGVYGIPSTFPVRMTQRPQQTRMIVRNGSRRKLFRKYARIVNWRSKSCVLLQSMVLATAMVLAQLSEWSPKGNSKLFIRI